MQSAQPIVSIKDLSHRYSGDWAIQDVNLDITTTGVVGLLGSNGAGKSTTMNILCGVLNPTKGAVLIDGIDMQKRPEEAKKRIGFLPQDTPLHFDLTIDEYLNHCAHLRLMKPERIPDAMKEAKEWTGLTHLSDRLIRNLSGGYRRRVGVAQALIHKPRLVVLDEPTTGLDPNQIVEIRRLIEEISKERSVLLSTHILPEVEAICQEIIMIDEGKTVFSGCVDEFKTHVEPHTIVMVLDAAPTEADFLAIDGITKAETVKEKTVRLHFDADPDVTKRVIEAGARGGWGLREVYLEENSLETVFAHLSNSAGKAFRNTPSP